MELYVAMSIFFIIFMYLRYYTGARIWEFFASGIAMYFVFQFTDTLALMFIFIGVSLYLLVDTFTGGGTT